MQTEWAYGGDLQPGSAFPSDRLEASDAKGLALPWVLKPRSICSGAVTGVGSLAKTYIPSPTSCDWRSLSFLLGLSPLLPYSVGVLFRLPTFPPDYFGGPGSVCVGTGSKEWTGNLKIVMSIKLPRLILEAFKAL